MPNPFFVALSGLTANSQGITLTGSNLANSNTIAYKGSNLFLHELVGATGSLSIGQGAIPASIQQVWSQGNIQQSALATDMAIQGNGFFMVSDGANTLYTRAGNMLINAEGKMVTSGVLFVLGNPVDSSGNIVANGNPVPLDLTPGKTLPPRPTSLIRFELNLNVEETVGNTFSASTIVFDSLGAEHSVTVEYTKTAAGWDYDMTLPAEDRVGGLLLQQWLPDL